MTQAQLHSTGTFLKIAEPGGGQGFDYAFGTANRIFAVDTGNGANSRIEEGGPAKILIHRFVWCGVEVGERASGSDLRPGAVQR